MRGAELEESTLTVVLDIRNPFAFLALGPAIAFGRERGLAINWLPLASKPLNPPSVPGPEDDRGVRHRRHRAHMLSREVAIYAEAQGLAIEEPYRNGPADAAHLAWLWMREQAPAELEPFLVELFRRYWALELDAAEREDVDEVIRAAGRDPAVFSAWVVSTGPAVLERVTAELGRAGVSAAPAYLVSDQIFLGRQHLPMIRWLLDEQRGPVPI